MKLMEMLGILKTRLSLFVAGIATRDFMWGARMDVGREFRLCCSGCPVFQVGDGDLVRAW